LSLKAQQIGIKEPGDLRKQNEVGDRRSSQYYHLQLMLIRTRPSSCEVYSPPCHHLYPIDLSNCLQPLAISRWQIHGQPPTKIMYAIPRITVGPGICLAHCQVSFPRSTLHQTVPFQLLSGNTYPGPRHTLPRVVPVRSAQEPVTTIKRPGRP
jgi:hypothetical protein